jgi:hypothetical protein
MRLFNTPIFLGIISLLLFGCVSSSITSSKSEKIHGPYKKIFVIIDNSERAEKFVGGFVETIKKELAARNTESEYYVSERLSQDTKQDINKKIHAFQPEVVLIMHQTESVFYRGMSIGNEKGSNGGTFDLKLFEKTENNLVWKAELTAYGEYGISTAISKASENLISKLVLDGIVSK